jgi:hypothetical protein
MSFQCAVMCSTAKERCAPLKQKNQHFSYPLERSYKRHNSSKFIILHIIFLHRSRFCAAVVLDGPGAVRPLGAGEPASSCFSGISFQKACCLLFLKHVPKTRACSRCAPRPRSGAPSWSVRTSRCRARWPRSSGSSTCRYGGLRFFGNLYILA